MLKEIITELNIEIISTSQAMIRQ